MGGNSPSTHSDETSTGSLYVSLEVCVLLPSNLISSIISPLKPLICKYGQGAYSAESSEFVLARAASEVVNRAN